MIVMVAEPVLPALSRALTVMTLVPLWSGRPDTNQDCPPVATPEPPALFDHETSAMERLLSAVPWTVTELVLVVYVEPEVGAVNATVGAPTGALNVAVTVVAAVTWMVHVLLEPQPPPVQPPKVDPVAGAAVRATDVPPAKFDEQLAPHVIPAGELVTVPLPVPALITARLNVVPAVAQAELEYGEKPEALKARTR
jgi:hypothetical protein